LVPADYVNEKGGYKIYDISDRAGEWRKASLDAHNEYVRSVGKRLLNQVNWTCPVSVDSF